LERGIKVELDKIEKGLQVRVTAVARPLFPTLSKFDKKSDNLIRGDRGQFPICSNVITESAEGVPVGLSRIFFQNSSCDTPDTW
jgi:hypothetical protein